MVFDILSISVDEDLLMTRLLGVLIDVDVTGTIVEERTIFDVVDPKKKIDIKI